MYSPCGDMVFDEAMSSVLQFEGGLTHDSADSGGWTNFGICQLDIDPETGKTFTESGIKSLTVSKAKNIYKEKYWDAMGCSYMPVLTSREVFDWGVNAGISRAINDLQRLIYSAQHDGQWGPATLNDLKYYLSKHSDHDLATAYAQLRENTYKHWGIGSQEVFLQGWLNRNEALARELGLAVNR